LNKCPICNNEDWKDYEDLCKDHQKKVMKEWQEEEKDLIKHYNSTRI
jgi:quinol monooxygenase YgiN